MGYPPERIHIPVFERWLQRLYIKWYRIDELLGHHSFISLITLADFLHVFQVDKLVISSCPIFFIFFGPRPPLLNSCKLLYESVNLRLADWFSDIFIHTITQAFLPFTCKGVGGHCNDGNIQF